ncbi:hypothetical protein J6590_073149 [Homalodisca vitripennis]|nr:hypothetical protein J6590_073149 [Homalodisca vitripennis]
MRCFDMFVVPALGTAVSHTGQILPFYVQTFTLFQVSKAKTIKQRRTWLLLGSVTAQQDCPCKQSPCLAIGGGSEVTFNTLVPWLGVRNRFLAISSLGKIRYY